MICKEPLPVMALSSQDDKSHVACKILNLGNQNHMFKTTSICTAALIISFLFGCVEDDLDLQLRFDENPGLVMEDPVLFEGSQIGLVKKIVYTETGDYLIDILVESNFKNAATVDSHFRIVENPKNKDKLAILIEQTKPGGKLLEDGARLDGMKQQTFLDRFIDDFSTSLQKKLDALKLEFGDRSEQIESGVESTINHISTQLEALNDKLHQLPQRQEIKELGQSLNRLHQQMMTTEKSIRTKIQTEIIPQIEAEVNRLKERLTPLERDEEVEVLETELEKIKQV